MGKTHTFDGVIKIIQFNWPYYVISILTVAACAISQVTSISPYLKHLALAGAFIALYFTVASIL
ncbi:MAG: hypothetical protein K8S54_16785, partial [Spirochaetia bacterium]|nr:hypothetical protein [Spirochaetia bacterium]